MKIDFEKAYPSMAERMKNIESCNNELNDLRIEIADMLAMNGDETLEQLEMKERMALMMQIINKAYEIDNHKIMAVLEEVLSIEARLFGELKGKK